jgi:signal transduction histidine kinase
VNIVSNAVDALVEVTERRHELYIVAEQRTKSRVHFTVKDTGTGMSHTTLQRIFEPYFTTKIPGKGTGLGLPVVRQIIESYGGEISVTSEVGYGTTCAFDLPAM